ncbi:hypothetical protein N657DRAFT_644139 [Parathielavia appendiculata]|uniref:Uncharacterized protein n=1 Tax=Parathielavia appendiculata TaxID=2587402 RepID=A0AAN6U2V5_9PEZI|nr:hypothetical protein N657DRAFT_644139 [Parathielavia appendiculata]
MSGPRTKRQFAGAASDPSQRQITSFFPKTVTSTSPTSANAARKLSNQAPLSAPVLPAQVQTDLLNVGMRVRKAIPEGYKTGGAYSTFTLWAEESTSNSSSDPRPVSATPTATYSSAMRELEPFCGINKIGGLAFQPSYHPEDDLEAMPGLTSSQDTIASTASTMSSTPATSLNVTAAAPSAPSRKRFFRSEEDEAAHDALGASLPYRGPFRLSSDNRDAWLEEEVSPRSLGPPAGMWENARLLAVPRRTRQGRKVEAAGELGGLGQENVMVTVPGQDGNDFEEASFLDYGLRADGRMDIG